MPVAKSYQPSAKRIPELNGLRVILVFLVSWYHIWQQSWLRPQIGSYSLDYLVRVGYMPVDGMILLSGFLLFLPYARTMLLGEKMPSVKQFYQRRIMRIVPSYYFVILVTFFLIALPWGLYHSAAQRNQDLITHLTFTHTFFWSSYQNSQIGGVTWTLAIEMQAYLLFPLIARLAMKNAAGTTGFMIAIAWMFRGLCLWQMDAYQMVVNQLPNFLDVYAIGILAAIAYVKLTQLWGKAKRPILWEALATVIVLVCVWGIAQIFRAQARSNGIEVIQSGQMMRRTEFALPLAAVIVALPFTVLPLRFLMGNRVMGWLSAISFNYYLVHQTLAVHLRRLHIPPSVSDLPNQAGEVAWQYPYTWLCFGLSLLLATAVTLLIEKPCAWALGKAFKKLEKKKA